VEAVYATGVVEPVSWARVSPVTPGRIVDLLAGEGETVKEGQVLARLDDREALARVAEMESRLVYLKSEVGRAADLAQKGFKSKEAEEKARSDYQQAAAALAAARQRHADMVVLSPMEGVVLRRDGEVGEVVDIQTVLFWVGAPRPLRITADVDEEDIARIRPGQRVLIKADAFPDRVLEGTLDRITLKGDPLSKTFRVRIALPDDTPLLVGMTTEINVVVAEKADALLIPAGALADGRVFVVEGDTARARPVTVGVRGRSRVEVVAGLSDGEAVIDSPPSTLATGTFVKVRAARTP
jgi:RND family efflux transporter MFP subunit